MREYTEPESIATWGISARGRGTLRSGIFEDEPRRFVRAVRCRHNVSIFEPCVECEVAAMREP